MVGAQMRIACSAAIYRKTLRMSKRATTQTSAGNVVNLLSNDVSRLDYGFIFVHFIWILPIQGDISCAILGTAIKIYVFCNFRLSLSTSSPPTLIRSLLNLLFNLARSEICCCCWRCWTLAENCADSDGIIESFIHSKVIENKIDRLFTFLTYRDAFAIRFDNNTLHVEWWRMLLSPLKSHCVIWFLDINGFSIEHKKWLQLVHLIGLERSLIENHNSTLGLKRD